MKKNGPTKGDNKQNNVAVKGRVSAAIDGGHHRLTRQQQINNKTMCSLKQFEGNLQG